VLPGMQDDLVDAGVAKGCGEGRRLDELRTVPDDGEDLHGRARLLARPHGPVVGRRGCGPRCEELSGRERDREAQLHEEGRVRALAADGRAPTTEALVPAVVPKRENRPLPPSCPSASTPISRAASRNGSPRDGTAPPWLPGTRCCLLCEAARDRFERGSAHGSLGRVENHPSGWGARFRMTTV
jgi:hypothetical protein